MALKPIDKSWATNKKDIKYLNRDFASLRQALVEFTKTYYSNTYNDFSEASPGMMFIEQAAYVGDILSYYTDAQLKESFINLASNKNNIYQLAQNLGYKPKISTPASVTLTLYQTLPSKWMATGATGSNSDRNFEPDFDYALKINEGMLVGSNSNQNVEFLTTDFVDFADTNNREVSVFTVDGSNNPITYLITKKVSAISATRYTQTFDVGEFKPNPTFRLTSTNFIKIESVKDSDDTTYYEVPYLAQEMVYIKSPNEAYNEPMLATANSPKYILKLQQTNKRFTTRLVDEQTIELRFGSGNESTPDELLIPNTKNVGLGLNNSINRMGESFDPSNFLKTNTYGIAPAQTTLTVNYLAGGGIQSNVPQGDLTKIKAVSFNDDILAFTNITLSVYNDARRSLVVENIEPATGGKGFETIEEIRENAIATFGAQNRAVTKKDYEVRALAMDTMFGGVAKVYVEQDGSIDTNAAQQVLRNPSVKKDFTNLVKSLKSSTDDEITLALDTFLKTKQTFAVENNPFAINMYLLGYDSNNKLTTLNATVKQNLKTYLEEYRLLTDAINLIDGYIVNIGVNFDITVFANYNKREVVLKCVQVVTNYFDINKWKMNQSINLSELELELANVDGVSSVPKVEIVNLADSTGLTYSQYSYNIVEATRNKIVYPSLDPSIFEIKYPNKDIKGRAL
jgi:hypothetical protein